MTLTFTKFLYQANTTNVMERINEIVMQIIAMYVATDHKDWDTYLQSAKYVYNISLSETTDDAPSFSTYVREPVKLPDVALLPPMLTVNNISGKFLVNF